MGNSVIDAQLTFKEFSHNLGRDPDTGQVWTYNGRLCLCHYYDKSGYAVFQCEDKGYVLKDETLYLLKDWSYINLILKIDTVMRQYDKEVPSIIRNALI